MKFKVFRFYKCRTPMAKLLRGLRQGGQMTDQVFPTFWECPPPILLGLYPAFFLFHMLIG
jgi:hypothetical protein